MRLRCNWKHNPSKTSKTKSQKAYDSLRRLFDFINVPNPYDPLHVDLSSLKSKYESELMRRNMAGEVDGDGANAGIVFVIRYKR